VEVKYPRPANDTLQSKFTRLKEKKKKKQRIEHVELMQLYTKPLMDKQSSEMELMRVLMEWLSITDELSKSQDLRKRVRSFSLRNPHTYFESW